MSSGGAPGRNSKSGLESGRFCHFSLLRPPTSQDDDQGDTPVTHGDVISVKPRATLTCVSDVVILPLRVSADSAGGGGGHVTGSETPTSQDDDHVALGVICVGNSAPVCLRFQETRGSPRNQGQRIEKGPREEIRGDPLILQHKVSLGGRGGGGGENVAPPEAARKADSADSASLNAGFVTPPPRGRGVTPPLVESPLRFGSSRQPTMDFDLTVLLPQPNLMSLPSPTSTSTPPVPTASMTTPSVSPVSPLFPATSFRPGSHAAGLSGLGLPMAHNLRVLPPSAFNTPAPALMVPFSHFADAPSAEGGDFLAFYDLSTFSLLRTVHPFGAGALASNPSNSLAGISYGSLGVHEYHEPTRQVLFGVSTQLCALDLRVADPSLTQLVKRAHTAPITTLQTVAQHSGSFEVLTHAPDEVKIWDLRKPTSPVFASSKAFPGHPLFHSSLWVVDHSGTRVSDMVVTTPTLMPAGETQLEVWSWNAESPMTRPVLCAELNHSQDLVTDSAATVKIFEGAWLMASYEGGVAVWKITGTSQGPPKKQKKARYYFDVPTGSDSIPFVDYADSVLVSGDEHVPTTSLPFPP